MTALHPYNRHLYISDNYKLLQSLESESIDLITTDPPFATGKKQTSSLKPPLSQKELDIERQILAEWDINNSTDAENAGIIWPVDDWNLATYADDWHWGKVEEVWMDSLSTDWPAVKEVVEAADAAGKTGMGAFTAYMAVRLIECRRILKPTGSLYLHCDHNANSYLRGLLDAIFGSANFRNEVIWHAATKSLQKNKWAANHDSILFYAKSSATNIKTIYIPYSDEYIATTFRHSDQHGRFGTGDLSGGKGGSSEAYMEFNGATPPGSRAWAPPTADKFPDSAQALLPSNYAELDALAKCHALDKAGMIVWSKNGKPSYKKYLDSMKGIPVGSVFDDIPVAKGDERTGYPTQKPWALAERIIEASSSPGDVVLDPFAGCAYTAVAAENLDRQWIACDISPRALTVLRRQFNKKGWAIGGEAATEDDGQSILGFVDVQVKGSHEIAERDTSADPISPTKKLSERKFKVAASDMPEREMKLLLAEVAGFQCWACGFATRDVTGEVVESVEHFHLDHIEPKSQGGSNYVHNRALLCAPCNIGKRSQRVPLKTFRDDPAVAVRRASYGHDTYPVDIDTVQTEAMLRWSKWRTDKGLDSTQQPLGLA